MSVNLRVALLGFGPGEQAFIESVFHRFRPGDRSPRRVEDPDDADMVLVNADARWTARNLRMRDPVLPVLLVGDDDAGTGWPVLSRPLTTQSLLAALGRLLATPSEGVAPAPEFAVTEPFVPLDPPRRMAPAHGFEETRPFVPAPRAGTATHAPKARTRPAFGAIDAGSVLMWREAKTGTADPPAGTPSPGVEPTPVLPANAPLPDAADAGLPPMAGFEPTREAQSHLPDKVPANWRELARRRDAERRQRTGSVEAGPHSSNFAEPADHLTSPSVLAGPGRLPAILLVGGSRLAGSSLIRELRGLGCQVDHARDRAAALDRLAVPAYGFALLDDRTLKGQTRAVCRALRRRARALGSSLTIVVLAREDGVLRRLLARWAGCDTWMTLPLDRDRLARFLQCGSGQRTDP